jgi:hypothetical protein
MYRSENCAQKMLSSSRMPDFCRNHEYGANVMYMKSTQPCARLRSLKLVYRKDPGHVDFSADVCDNASAEEKQSGSD